MGHPLCTSANRVLVVDDCADTVSTLAWLLSSSGFHVLQATSAEEALSHADRFQPDAVLLDLSLGGQISGFEAVSYTHLTLPTNREV